MRSINDSETALLPEPLSKLIYKCISGFASVTASAQTLLNAEGLIGDKQFIVILPEDYKENIPYKKKPEDNL